jgi:hypothetical protein
MAFFPQGGFGFRPLIRDGGGPFSVAQYAKPASDTNVISCFDLVQKVPGGVVNPEQPDYNLPAIQTGTTGTPGTTLWLGVNLSYGTPSKLSVHAVVDEIDAVFIAGANNGVVVVSTAAFAGKNCNAQLQPPIAVKRTSRHNIDPTTVAANAALDCRIRNLAMIAPSSDGVAGAWMEVTINKHFYAQGSPGI